MANKVVLIGTGAVGISYAFALLNQGTVDDLVLIDLNEKVVHAHVNDLRHGLAYAPTQTRIKVGTYEDCQDADLVCICAGIPQKPGQTRLELIDNNLEVFHSIVSDVKASGFDGIYLIATNPVDVLAYATHKFSGASASKVIGSGTILDTARLKYGISEVFGYAPSSINAYMAGEHGDSVIPVWSNANVAGMSIKEELEKQDGNAKEKMDEIYKDVRDAAYRIIEGKGATYYGIAMGLARITRAVLQNEDAVLTVSALLEGQYGDEGIYTGVPAVINAKGIDRIIEAPLSDEEQANFKKSSDVLRDMQKQVDDFKA